MEMSGKLKKNDKHFYFDKNDLALECCGYLKTKLFMAKRICEQQIEIDQLKEALFKMTIKYTNLFDVVKTFQNTNFANKKIDDHLQKEHFTFNNPETVLEKSEEQLKSPISSKSRTINNEEDDPLNLSGNCAKSLDFETKNEKNISNEIKNHATKNQKFNKESKIHDEITILRQENIELKKQNEVLIQELSNSHLENSKISYEKFNLFTELCELLQALEKIDLNALNGFYLNNMKYENTDTKHLIASSMGIKYNILSASTSLGIRSLSNIINDKRPYFTDDLRSIFSNNCNNNKNFDFNFSNFTEGDNHEEKYLTGKYLSILKEKINKFDEELNNYVYKAPEKTGNFKDSYRNTSIQTNSISTRVNSALNYTG